MQPCSKSLLVLTAFLSCILGITAYYDNIDLEEKVNEMAEQIEEQTKMMKKMAANIEMMAETNEKFKKVFGSENETPTVTQGQKITQEQEITQGQKTTQEQEIMSDIGNPITIQELRREPAGEQTFKYTVRYFKNTNEIFSTVVIPPYSWLDPNITVIDGRTEEASFTSYEESNNEDSYSQEIYFMFYDKDLTHGISLALRKPDAESSKHETLVLNSHEFNVPKLETNPTKELVYEDGYDVDIKITASNSTEDQSMHAQAYLYNLDTKEFALVYLDHDEEFVRMSELKNVTDGVEVTATVKMSEKRVCGFAEIMANHYTTDSILSFLSVSKLIEVRPSSQAQPFPQDVIGFFEDSNRYHGEGGVEICEIKGGKCGAHCVAGGGNIFGVTVQEEHPNGDLVPVELASNRWSTQYLKVAYFTFPDPPLDQINTSKRFICTATAFDGRTATKEITVKFVLSAKFIENSSEARVTQEGSVKTVELKCAGTGMPLPNVTFNVYFDHDSMWDAAPDKVSISENGTVIIAWKTVSWDTSVPYGEGKGALGSASCSVMSDYGGGSYGKEIALPQNL